MENAENANDVADSVNDITSAVSQLAKAGKDINGNTIDDVATKVRMLDQAKKTLFGGNQSVESVDDISTAVSNLAKSGEKLMHDMDGDSVSNVAKAMKEADEAGEKLMHEAPEIAESMAKASVETAGLGTKLSAVGVTIKGILTGAAGAGAMIAGWAAIIGAIGFAIYKVHDALTLSNKEIAEMQDEITGLSKEYQDGVSKVESLNSELTDVNKQIRDIQSKGTITLSDQEDLDRLKEQSEELERQVKLQEEKNRLKAAEVVSTLRENSEALNEGMTRAVENYKSAIQEIEDTKEKGARSLAKNEINEDDYEFQLGVDEDGLESAKQRLLDEIEDFEANRKAIIDKYNGDISKIRGNDKTLYDDIVSQLSDAYDLYYSNADYYKFVIKPVLDTDGLDDMGDKLTEYFSNGGKIDEKSLTNAFGETIIDSLKKACENSGIDFKKFIQKIFDDASQTEYGFAPITTETPNSAFEAKQLAESKKKIDYYKSLSAEVRASISDMEIPKRVRDGNLETFKSWVAGLQDFKDVIDKTSYSSIADSVQSVKDNLASGLAEIGNAYKEIFTSDGFDINAVDNDMLSKLKETLEAMEGFDASSIEEFFDILTSSDSQEEVQNAFDNIATEYIRLSGVIKDVNQETRDAMTQQLEQLGATNAGEVFDELLEKQQAYAEYQSEFATANDEYAGSLENVVSMSQAQIVALLAQSEASDVAKRALLELAVAQGSITDGTIDTEQDINAIIELAQAAGLATATLTSLEAVKNGTVKDSDAAAFIVKNAKDKIKKEMSGFKLGFDFDYKGTAKKAGKAGKDAGKEYASEFKSAMDSILSGVLDKLGDQIDDLNDKMKDAQQALEDEKDAAINNIQIQIDGIQDQIDAKNEYIDQLEKERKTRENNLKLQKAQYELERAQNQRTILQYSESKGMHYVSDESSIRDKREEVDEIKYDMYIDSLNDEIDLLNKQKDLLEDQKDSISDYYDKAIEASNKYYEDLIANIEKTKSKYEELKDLADQAQFQALIETYGLNEQALLSGSTDEFNKFKDIYVQAIAGVNQGNDAVLRALTQLSGVDLSGTNSSLAQTATSLEDASTSATNASNSISDVNDNASKASSSLNDVQNAIDTLNSEGNLDTLQNTIQAVVDLLDKVKDGLIGDDGLKGAFAILESIDIATVIEQFDALTTAINGASSAINGGGGSEKSGSKAGIPTDLPSNAISQSSGGESTGVVGSIEKLGETSEEVLGSTDDDGGSGVIGKFGALKTAAEAVTNAIGLEDTEPEDGGEPILIPSMRLMQRVGVEANASLQESFNSTMGVVQALIAEVEKLIELMASAASMGSGLSTGGASFAKGTTGNAYANGVSGLKQNEKNALRSEYGQPELTVYPNGQYEVTTTPTISDLPKDTVIYPEDETRKILNGKNGIIGKAFANGSSSISFGGKTMVANEFIDLQNKISGAIIGKTIPAINMLGDTATSVADKLSNFVSNKSVQTQEIHNEIHVSLPNVTDSTSATALLRDLETIAIKKYQKF